MDYKGEAEYQQAMNDQAYAEMEHNQDANYAEHLANQKIACPICAGSGEVERNISYEGLCEADVMMICPECDGLGEVEDEETENQNDEFFNDHPDNLIALDALYNKTKGQSERTPKITSETDAEGLF